LPKTRHAWAHLLVASCNHLLLQILAPARGTGDGNKSKKHILSDTHLIDIACYLGLPAIAIGTWVKRQVASDSFNGI